VCCVLCYFVLFVCAFGVYIRVLLCVCLWEVCCLCVMWCHDVSVCLIFCVWYVCLL